MTFSIRKRLLFLLLSVISGIWSIITWQVYVNAQHEVEELFDANLAQNARVLLGLVRHEMREYEEDMDEDEDDDAEEIELEEHLHGHRYEHKLAFSVRTLDGRVLVHSAMSPLFPLPHQFQSRHHRHRPAQEVTPERHEKHSFASRWNEKEKAGTLEREKRRYYNDVQIKNYWWRVFTLKSNQFLIQTGERYDIRQELIHEILSSTLIVLLITFPLLALLIWVSVGHSFKPLQQVATEIAARRPEQLHPIENIKIPLEIRDLINALNQLFIRLTRAFENERRFTADAAHELRTPLAGLKIQAQVAQRTLEPHKREQALQQILRGVDRATHLVTQLLTLARMDATQTMPKSPVNMDQLINQIMIDLMPQALAKTIDLGVEKRANGCIILGNQEALYLMFRNFVDNAIRYTPTGGQVTIGLDNRQASQLTITLNDTGPGIPPEQRAHIFERFYRGNHQNIQGSGLGLSIAQQIAQLHQINIQLLEGQNGRGLCVRVDFRVNTVPEMIVLPD
jgi:two-component system sensor histidine kinase QseC